jgi:rhamnosyltransferase
MLDNLPRNIALIILVYNGVKFIDQLILGVESQSLAIKNIIFIDSSSTDASLEKIKSSGFRFEVIPQEDFGHGKTRQWATTLVDADFYIFMTQDALPANQEAFTNLLAAFQNEKVGCAYGRQLPAKDADVLATHARFYNYPEQSCIKSYADREKLGIKTCFNSDSFAAYRKKALLDVGGFSENLNFGEDMYVAAKMLLNGWLVAYQADAQVYHSHNYSVWQEFNRYFSIGRFHAQNLWLLEKFKGPEGEGIKFMKSEISFCWRQHNYIALVQSLNHVFFKYLGYKLGIYL